MFVLTTMHTLNVHFKFLWLAEFPSAEVAQRFCPLWIRTASVGAMHFEIVQSKEELLAELALICAFAVVLLDSVFHNVILSDKCSTTHLQAKG